MQKVFDAKVVVTLWCDLSVRSPWVMVESLVARHQEKFLPVRIASCTLPKEFASNQYTDLVGWSGEPVSSILRPLISEIERKSGKRRAVNEKKIDELCRHWEKDRNPDLAFYVGEVEAGHTRRDTKAAATLTTANLSKETRPENTAASRIWAGLKDSDDEVMINDFIEDFPDTPEAALARAKLNDLEWQKLRESDDIGGLKAFAQSHKGTAEGFKAKQRLRQVEAWLAVHKTNYWALHTYIAANPPADLLAKAETELKKLPARGSGYLKLIAELEKPE